jgi:hypothetical protein
VREMQDMQPGLHRRSLERIGNTSSQHFCYTDAERRCGNKMNCSSRCLSCRQTSKGSDCVRRSDLSSISSDLRLLSGK